MAIYHFHVGIVQRSKGQSAVASAAYRAGQKLSDERLGIIFDYTRRQGVLHTEIMAPDNVPAWMSDRLQLWNAVEKAEKRKDSQVARSVDISLMSELSFEKNLELLRSFVKEQWVDNGMVADIAIHAPGRDGDERNIHAHILLTMRELLPNGFGLKDRSWNRDAALLEWREAWANHANAMLEREGVAERIDHRSLKDQAIDREPTIHVGPSGQEIEKRGDKSDRAQQNRDIKNANDEMELLEKELAETEKRIAELKAQLAGERMGQIQNTVSAADAVWKDAEQRLAQARRLQPQGSTPPSHPEDFPQPSGGKAPSMPDDLSEQQKASATEELDKTLAAEKERQDKAIADELQRQEDARRAQDELRDSLIAADKKLKELGEIYRQAQEHREQIIKQALELEQASLRHEREEIARQREESERKQNPVENYIDEHKDAVEDRRQGRIYMQERNYVEGDIRNPYSRYAQALHNNFEQAGDPYQGLARSAIAEHAAFRQEQDLLHVEIAQTADPKAREALEIRRKIEGYEYLVITGDRIAKQSELITGRLNSDEAVRMRELCHGVEIEDEKGNKVRVKDGYEQIAQKLRQQYRDLQAERQAERAPERGPVHTPTQSQAQPKKEGKPSRQYEELIKAQRDAQIAKEQKQQKPEPDPERERKRRGRER